MIMQPPERLGPAAAGYVGAAMLPGLPLRSLHDLQRLAGLVQPRPFQPERLTPAEFLFTTFVTRSHTLLKIADECNRATDTMFTAILIAVAVAPAKARHALQTRETVVDPQASEGC